MIDIENSPVCARALAKHGTIQQMHQTIEECAELTVALLHYLRKKATAEEVAGEVADVLIMAHQMRHAFGPELVDEIVAAKIERLKTRLAQ